ncbi:MAG: hypothetical protein ACE5O2_15610 [Armatimonadota bacterium]
MEIAGLSWKIVGIWVAALLTLCIYSFLYKDNPFYKFAEHLFVGISQGWGVAMVYYNVVLPDMVKAIFPGDEPGAPEPQYVTLIPIAIGLMWFTRFIPGVRWMVRIPIACVVGWGAGINLVSVIHGFVLPQMQSTFLPVVAKGPDGNFSAWTSFNNVLLIVGVITTLAYFYFSREHKGVLGGASKVGIYFLMAAFGAGFGYTVMARVSLLIGRVHFLLFDWLNLR